MRVGRAGVVAGVARPAVALCLVALLVVTGCSSVAGDPVPAAVPPATGAARTPKVGPCPALAPAPRVDGGLPDLTLPCLGGGPDVRLSDLRGTPTVVNVWAAWCTNCDREMPLFAEAVRAYGEQVRFLGIHYKASRAQGLASQRDFGVPFPSVHDADGDRVVRRLGAFAPPQTFFVDAGGRVVGREIGEITSGRALRDLIARHLGVTA